MPMGSVRVRRRGKSPPGRLVTAVPCTPEVESPRIPAFEGGLMPEPEGRTIEAVGNSGPG